MSTTDRTSSTPATHDDDSRSAPVLEQSPQKPAPARPHRRRWPWVLGLSVIVVATAFGIPWLRNALTTVSTDDAYVNGHVTFVAPRVNGQVRTVRVEDNNVVRKNDLLVE